jgi:hypothetical protein
MNHFDFQNRLPCDPQEQSPEEHAAVMAALWSRTSMLKEIWAIVQRVQTWSGAKITPTHGGLCLAVRRVRLGFLHWNGRIDLPFGPQANRQIMRAWNAGDEGDGHAVPGVFEVREMADVDRAVWLLRLAYLIGEPGTNLYAESEETIFATKKAREVFDS